MSSDHFLVSFQPAVSVLALKCALGIRDKGKTDAPPELSEPAMTSIRLFSMFTVFLFADH